MYIYIYIDVYMYIHIYTYIYIHIYFFSSLSLSLALKAAITHYNQALQLRQGTFPSERESERDRERERAIDRQRERERSRKRESDRETERASVKEREITTTRLFRCARVPPPSLLLSLPVYLSLYILAISLSFSLSSLSPLDSQGAW
jgi:hypothetical protein